jgi:hypothetical protein
LLLVRMYWKDVKGTQKGNRSLSTVELQASVRQT